MQNYKNFQEYETPTEKYYTFTVLNDNNQKEYRRIKREEVKINRDGGVC